MVPAGRLVEDVDGRVFDREQGPGARVKRLKVDLRRGDVLADEVLDLVDHRAAAHGDRILRPALTMAPGEGLWSTILPLSSGLSVKRSETRG